MQMSKGKGSAMIFFLYFILLAFIVVPIVAIWKTAANFVAWWCMFIGVADTGAVSTAQGIFAGGSLLFIIYLIWSFIATLIAYLDASER
jgi:hypothetical protein